jgi:hypothetical protein
MPSPPWKTAEDVAEGYFSLNMATLKRFQPQELEALARELEKVLRDTRAMIVTDNDAEKAQQKNRRMLRISQATTVLQSYRARQGR